MLTTSLRSLTDDRWNAFWPVNELKPLVILDYVTYFLFIKKLDEQQLLLESKRNSSGNTFLYSKENDELRWTQFKDMDPKNLYKLFTKEKGVLDFMNDYGQANHLYSIYLKEPLLITPTPKLLMNTVDFIKFMEAEDSMSHAAIYEYLLNKQEIAGQNGQVFAPDKIVKLLVALMKPNADDLVWDPSAGNGSLLVNSLKYIVNNHIASGNKSKIFADNFKGIDFDLIQLRIAAMNMILNGINNPELEIVNIFQDPEFRPKRQPTLILSNLFFKESEDKLSVEKETKTEIGGRKEIGFLSLIIKNLKPGGRAAVIIPEKILYDNGTDALSIRQQIINEYSLDAVISLPGNAISLFSRASILIINRSKSNVTDKVWYYKMKVDAAYMKDQDAFSNVNTNASAYTEEYPDVQEILSLWNLPEKEGLKKTSDKSFFVPADEIKSNHYNLSYNVYKHHATAAEPITVSEKPILKARYSKKRLAIISMLLIVFTSMVLVYFFYFKNKNDNTIADNKHTVPTTVIKTKPDLDSRLPDTFPILKSKKGDKIWRDNINTQPKALPGKITSRKNSVNDVAIQKNASTPQSNKPVDATASAGLDAKEKYTVVQKAYFHNQPNGSTRRSAFINHWNNAVLNPMDERNGFIYIVYTNHQGQTSKGWLNKKDLRPIK